MDAPQSSALLAGFIARRALGAIALSLVIAVSFALPCRARPLAQAAEPGPINGPRLVLPAASEFRAGDTIEVRWDAVDPSLDELELLLSLDGGRHYTLRISPELDPDHAAFRWRVPNLASGEARLRLRFHRDGRECDGEASRPFRIAAEGADAELDQFHEGGWWSGEREVEIPLAIPDLLPAGSPVLTSAAGSPLGVTSRDVIERRSSATPETLRPEASRSEPRPAARTDNTPRFVPSRN
jgi:hypothetical protein